MTEKYNIPIEPFEEIDQKIDMLLRSRTEHKEIKLYVPEPSGWVWEIYKRAIND